MSAAEEPSIKKLRMTSDLEMSDHNFDDLPNEILLKILDYLHIKDLIRCGQTFRRLRFAVHDESLWKKVNLSNKRTVPAGLLQLILERGCEYLNINDRISHRIVGNLTPTQTTKLKCLNLAWKYEIRDIRAFQRNAEVSEELLRSCSFLEKLELYCVSLNSDSGLNICTRNGKTLKILRLSFCNRFHESLNDRQTRPLELDFIQPIVDQCVELEELSFYKSRLSEDSIEYLVKNITPKVSKLSLHTTDAIVIDKYILMLVRRCKNLTELSLSGLGITHDSVNYIVENLHSTLEKLSLIRTSVSVLQLFELKAMKKLTLLSFNSRKTDTRKINEDMERFKRENPHIQSNCISKPTWSSDDFSTFRSYEERIHYE
jgi:hypothetical protein